MPSSLRRTCILSLICLLAALSTRPAQAQLGNVGISKGQATAIGVGIVAIGVAIGIGVYFLVRTPPTITGCAVTGPTGLSLQAAGDSHTFLLTGDTAAITPGDRVKLKGKRQKKDAAGNRAYLVTILKKDYGPCTAPPPH